MGDWAVLELTSKSEGEDPSVLIRSISNVLKCPEVVIFVPAAVTQIGLDKVVHYLVEGYAFVKNPGKRLKRLEDTRYVKSVLLGTVCDADIDKMRSQIQIEVDQGIGVGDTVKIVSGPYRNLYASVVEDIPEKQLVQVFIKLRSKQDIVTLPRSFLQVTQRTPLSKLFSRLALVKKWSIKALRIFSCNLDSASLLVSLENYTRLHNWSNRDFSSLHAFLDDPVDVPFHSLSNNLKEVLYLDKCTKKANCLWNLYKFLVSSRLSKIMELIKSKLVLIYWMEDIFERCSILERDLEKIQHLLAKRKVSGVKIMQNVIVDGHNLVFRCLYAPGMADLVDKQGRPTGIILGFLRSLGALRGRFLESRIYVTWDGSSQRRKMIFSEYKGTRKSHAITESNFNPVDFLKCLLPKLGVWQCFNAEEEADDVIATLVLGSLLGQHNVIYSTDKDMLSLVTPDTYVLMPGTGVRKEILYDVSTVCSNFGVPSSNLVHLRAFLGDPSDNIPGVSRVPKKLFRSLIQTYKTVEGVYKSGLTGLSDSQYDKIRLFEPQARMNLLLMSFVDVPITTVDPDVDKMEATKWLQDLDINPDSVKKALGL